jgi:5-methylcytosine-specific restriction endonuclease McrA
VFLEVYPQVLGVSTHKVCTKCGELKPADSAHFSANRGKLRSYCRQCARGYNLAYYADNADEMRARSKAYHREHDAGKRQEKQAYDREYARANAEKKRQKAAEFRKNNPEYMVKWRLDHADRLRAWRKSEDGHKASGVIAHRRRARKLAVGGSYTPADIEAIRAAQGNRCYLCGKKLKRFHIDHFIPLALGGTNDPGNLRLACPKCNLSKGAKHPHDMGRLI